MALKLTEAQIRQETQTRWDQLLHRNQVKVKCPWCGRLTQDRCGHHYNRCYLAGSYEERMVCYGIEREVFDAALKAGPRIEPA